jgi:hypothetical protein
VFIEGAAHPIDGPHPGKTAQMIRMAPDGAERLSPDRTRARRGPGAPGALALAALALAGCQRDDVAHYRVPKAQPAMVAGAAAVPADPVSPGEGLRWTLPAGWKEASGGGQMRYATLTPPATGKLDVSVIRLPGPAGGELANVNRWRNQIGLAPIGEADLAPARKTLRSAAGDLNVYDFSSEGTRKTRTIAGLASIRGETWFVKMTGDAEAVASSRVAFLDLLGSLRLEAR